MKQYPTAVVANPESWISLTAFREFAANTAGKRPEDVKVSPLLNALLGRLSVPTHEVNNVGYSGKQQINRLLQTAPSKIDLAFGATSLIRVLDAAAAQHAGLRGYDYETLSALSSLVPTSTLAAGVRLQPETIEGPSAHRSIPSPFVAEIAVVDNRIQPVYGTEGLIHAIHANREVLRSGTALAGRMFDGIQDTPALLRDMAIPAEEVILLTTRGIDSFM